MADIKVEINQTIDPRMTTLDNSKPQRPTKLPQLGAPKWKDPERRQSIKYDSRVKMEWQLCTSLLAMNCWIALEPAKRCLNEAIQQIENLIIVKRNADVWDGEQTSPGCVWDRSMHGRSVKDAQPSVIFSSSSKICRRNAKRIIKEEKIVVDPRGIGIEYYETGPEFLAGFDDLEDGSSSHTSKDSRFKEKQSAGSLGLTPTHSNTLPPTPRPEPEDIKTKKAINGALVQIGNVTCTFGGFIFVGEELFGLTVAHPFDNKAGDLSTKPVKIKAPSTLVLPGLENPIGILNNKRALVRFDTIRRPDLDWSLCKVNGLLVHLTNKVFVPNGGITYPRRIPEEDPADKVVVVHSGRGGVVSGAIMADYSLVALPGRKSFQRMWIVVLERVVQKGDCGSWVIDPITEDWLGHIIAGKPGTRVAYMVLSRDIARSISDEMCGKPVRIPSEAEMEITAAVRDVKDSLFIPQNAFSTQAPSLSQYQAPGNATNGLQRATSEDYTPCVRERTISISSTNFSTFTPAQAREPFTIAMPENKREVEGYPKLASHMAAWPSSCITRSFNNLAIKNILYLQAELVSLEGELRRVELCDSQSSERVNTLFSKDWYWLNNSLESNDSTQMKIMLKIREVLHKYRKALLQQAGISALPQANPQDLKLLQKWIESPDLGNLSLIGKDRNIWGDSDSPHTCAPDLVALDKCPPKDIYQMALKTRILALWHRYSWRSTKESRDIESGLKVYRGDRVIKWMVSFSTVLASLLPILSVVLLYWVKTVAWKLGLVTLFSFLFAMAMAFLTNAKGVEVFTATAAFAAVEVVFISNNVGGI